MPDVVIVGGGVIGAACALELAERGASVTLVERDHLAAHASGRNQGLWVLPEDEANVPMALASLETYRRVAAEGPVDVAMDPEPIGQLLVAADSGEFRSAEAAVALARRHDVPVDDLDSPGAIHNVEPALNPNLAGAWLVHHGHRLDPGALTVAMALMAAGRGAVIRHHLHVRSLATRDDRVVGIVTDEGMIDAPTTIVAAGPWSHDLLDPVGIRLPITGARGWIVRVRPAPGLLHHLVESPGPHEALRGEVATRRPTAGEVVARGLPGSAIGSLLHPHRSGRTVMIGSSRQTWLTPEPNDDAVVAASLAAAIELVPAIADADVLSSWWGLRPLSPDERPFVGPVREGLHVATGHGSEGVILGAGTARLVAAPLVREDPPFDGTAFEPLRFEGDAQNGDQRTR
jgi:glycine/D-amino acid oxidase-like deaminating enzyme